MATGLSLAASAVPALLWLGLFRRLPRIGRQPKLVVVRMFGWGLLAGPWASGVNALLLAALDDRTASRLVLVAVVIFVAVNEETVKYVVAANASSGEPAFNQRVDGVIYLASAALGFAAGENFLVFIATLAGFSDDAPREMVRAVLLLAPVRAVVTTLGHVAWSSIAGYAHGRMVVDGAGKAGVRAALAVAAVLHAAYNLPQYIRSTATTSALTWHDLASGCAWLVAACVCGVLLVRALRASPLRTRQLFALGAPQQFAYAVIEIDEEGRHPRHCVVTGGVVLGRTQHGLAIRDPRVSRRHALLAATDQGLVVDDLGSMNGTYLNGSRISGATMVTRGDVVEVGTTRVRLVESPDDL